MTDQSTTEQPRLNLSQHGMMRHSLTERSTTGYTTSEHIRAQLHTAQHSMAQHSITQHRALQHTHLAVEHQANVCETTEQLPVHLSTLPLEECCPGHPRLHEAQPPHRWRIAEPSPAIQYALLCVCDCVRRLIMVTHVARHCLPMAVLNFHIFELRFMIPFKTEVQVVVCL